MAQAAFGDLGTLLGGFEAGDRLVQRVEAVLRCADVIHQ